MDVTIEPGRARGTITAPRSKSHAHRLLLAAALTGPGATVHGVEDSGDLRATLGCIRALGGELIREGDTVRILRPMTGEGSGICPCFESGSTLRFVLPLALTLREETVFTGSRRLMERGAELYGACLPGVTLRGEPERLTVRGTLRPGDYTLRGDVSSQYVSGLLLSLPRLSGDSTVTVLPPVESRPYIRITREVLGKSGITVRETEENRFVIPGGQTYALPESIVEGDWSNAAVFHALNALGGEVTIAGLREDSPQGDRVCRELLQRLGTPGAVIDLADTPDLAPVLFAAAACLHGGIFTGTGRLRLKESDRARVMARELSKFSVPVTVEADRVVIPEVPLCAPTEPLCAHGDHRIVMALSLLCTRTGGTVRGAEAVRKSYPAFFDGLTALGLSVKQNNEETE